MNSHNSNEYGYLERVRVNEGADKCREALKETARRDLRRAVSLLNDRGLTFPCLYILMEQIKSLRIERYLNQRNRVAMRITAQIKVSGAAENEALPVNGAVGNGTLSSKQEAVRSVLKWILETGAAAELPEDEYEEVIDVAAAVLIDIYREKSVLPLVADLIFRRNRDGRYIHDLVWALFRVHDPEVLKLIASRVRSENAKDAGLAAELLNLDETDVPAGEGDGDGRYESYLRWLSENEPYLYFTEESFQYASKPAFAAVDRERKYLQEGVPSYDKVPLAPPDGETGEILACFKQLGGEEQKLLADYSHKIRGESVPAWKEWLRAPVEGQIKAAKTGLEGKK